jgi:hypothetical protein
MDAPKKQPRVAEGEFLSTMEIELRNPQEILVSKVRVLRDKWERMSDPGGPKEATELGRRLIIGAVNIWDSWAPGPGY